VALGEACDASVVAPETSENQFRRAFGFLHGRGRQLVRYAGVSVISTVASLSVLGILVGVFGVRAAVANLAATAVGTVPSYELNRRFVWARRDRRSIGREMIPFCVLSFAGLLLSTVTVSWAGALTASRDRLVHTAAVQVANLFAYGSLWVVQFIVLDRVLFARRA
jgi:putative flippase GtrA